MANSNPIIGQYLTTTPIIYSNNNHATGFYFRHRGVSYLVTNLHALDFITENGDNLQEVEIRIRNNPEDLDEFTQKTISLLDADNNPKWINDNPRVDLALIPLTSETVGERIDILPPSQVNNGDKYEYGNLAFETKDFPESSPMKMTVSGGSGAIILGYPLVFFGPSYPVARSANISSPYGRTIEDLTGSPADLPKDAFLTDAVTHPGLSGSPVISEPPESILQNPNTPETIYKAATLMEYDNKLALYGVHAGEFDQYSNLQLNNAVYPSAIMDLLEPEDTQDSFEDYN